MKEFGSFIWNRSTHDYSRNQGQTPKASANRSPVLTSVSNMPIMKLSYTCPAWTQDRLGARGQGVTQGNGRIPLLAHMVMMKMMMMKLFCMQGRGLCYKHSLRFPLMQPLPPSVCNLQTLHGFSQLGFALQGVCSFSSANPPCCTVWSGYS